MAANSAPVRLLTRSEVRSMVQWPALIEATARAPIDATGPSAVAAASQLRVPGAALLGHPRPAQVIICAAAARRSGPAGLDTLRPRPEMAWAAAALCRR